MAARADYPARRVRILTRGFHGKRLRDTFHGTTGSIERRQDSGGSRCRRSCHSKNRDHAGRCSASAPTGFASVRLVIFSDATRATVGSTRGITYGLRITRGRCRTRCKIKRNSATGSTASVCGACELGRRECPRLITPTHDDAALMILSRYCA